MPALVPNRFLIRVAHPCVYVKSMPLTGDEDTQLVDLPETARLNNFTALDDGKNFADVRIAWNELGVGVQVVVKGKDQVTTGDAEKPRTADGLWLWLDTRDARVSHRASRYCHQFYLLPTGGGPDKEEPAFGQTKINRALQEAPLCTPSDVLFRCHNTPSDVLFRCHKLKGGYRLEAFLPASTLSGYDPEQHPRLGVFYQVRDQELGDQTLSVNSDFPFTDDPSLWEVLELVKGK